jgi:hypothetical protein
MSSGYRAARKRPAISEAIVVLVAMFAAVLEPGAVTSTTSFGATSVLGAGST